jgi:GntR family transcriptional regulator
VADAETHPSWELLAAALRLRIEAGDLAPGDKLPSEADLTAESGLNRTTVRKALAHLESAGLVESQQGRGRIVRGRERIGFSMSAFELGAFVDDPSNGRDQWKQGVEAAGWVPRQVVAGVDRLPAPQQVAEWLDLPPGTEVVRRRRIRSVANPDRGIGWRVAMIADTWTPIDIAEMTVDGTAPLLSADDVTLPGGIYYALGFRQVRFLDSIDVRMPTGEESELMQLGPGTPVGQHARVGVDQSGQRVRVLVQTWAGDRQFITYDLAVPERRLPTNGAQK